jgi:MFS family permease
VSYSSITTPLHRPLFRALWIASIVSNIGTWMQEVGEGWLMTSLTTSPTIIALLETAVTLPVFLLSLPAGALADILDRRRILIFTQTWMLVAAAVMSALAFAGLMTPWILLLMTFTLSLGVALNGPAWQAIIPELVDRTDLPSAIALGSVGFNVARAVGPAIGGLIIAASGPWAVFMLNAASFLGVIIVLYRWEREHHESILPAERMIGAIRAGVRYVRHAPSLQAVLARTLIFIFFASGMWATLPYIARHEMNLTSLQFGLFMTALGMGAVTGAAVMGSLRSVVTPDRMVRGATVVFALLLLTLGNVRMFGILLIAMLMGGIAWMILMSSLNTAAQIASPEWVRARSMALYILVFMGSFAGGSAVWGLVASHSGVRLALSLASVGAAAGVFAPKRFSLSSVDKTDLAPSMHWADPVIAVEPSPEHGPVLITIEYRVKEANIPSFSKAIHALSSVRRRDGAVQWGIFKDVSDPQRFVEHFIVESWGEHLRQHERVTVADREVEDRVRAFHDSGGEPQVSHFIYADELDTK